MKTRIPLIRQPWAAPRSGAVHAVKSVSQSLLMRLNQIKRASAQLSTTTVIEDQTKKIKQPFVLFPINNGLLPTHQPAPQIGAAGIAIFDGIVYISFLSRDKNNVLLNPPIGTVYKYNKEGIAQSRWHYDFDLSKGELAPIRGSEFYLLSGQISIYRYDPITGSLLASIEGSPDFQILPIPSKINTNLLGGEILNIIRFYRNIGLYDNTGSKIGNSNIAYDLEGAVHTWSGVLTGADARDLYYNDVDQNTVDTKIFGPNAECITVYKVGSQIKAFSSAGIGHMSLSFIESDWSPIPSAGDTYEVLALQSKEVVKIVAMDDGSYIISELNVSDFEQCQVMGVTTKDIYEKVDASGNSLGFFNPYLEHTNLNVFPCSYGDVFYTGEYTGFNVIDLIRFHIVKYINGVYSADWYILPEDTLDSVTAMDTDEDGNLYVLINYYRDPQFFGHVLVYDANTNNLIREWDVKGELDF